MNQDGTKVTTTDRTDQRLRRVALYTATLLLAALLVHPSASADTDRQILLLEQRAAHVEAWTANPEAFAGASFTVVMDDSQPSVLSDTRAIAGVEHPATLGGCAAEQWVTAESDDGLPFVCQQDGSVHRWAEQAAGPHRLAPMTDLEKANDELKRLAMPVPESARSHGLENPFAGLESTVGVVNDVADTYDLSLNPDVGMLPAAFSASQSGSMLRVLADVVAPLITNAHTDTVLLTIGGDCHAAGAVFTGLGDCYGYRVASARSNASRTDIVFEIIESAPTPGDGPTRRRLYTDYYPTEWNGRKVVLSPACHDGNDRQPGGDCIENVGCQGYRENEGARYAAIFAAVGADMAQSNLIDRGYAVRVVFGTVRENIDNSNEFVTDSLRSLHLPMHSNAAGSGPCNSNANGARMLWESQRSGDAASEFVSAYRTGTPGSDAASYDPSNAETRPANVDAVPVYLESEFHTWNQGVNFLSAQEEWVWRIGVGADRCFGYPRLNNNGDQIRFGAVPRCDWALRF